MRSAIHDVLPTALRRSLAKFGHDLAVARRKRHLTVAMMAQRTGLAIATYTRIEKGDPSVAMGAYAMGADRIVMQFSRPPCLITSKDFEGSFHIAVGDFFGRMRLGRRCSSKSNPSSSWRASVTLPKGSPKPKTNSAI